ncbi:hypothetical protein C9374_011728 [Naegleria lovaniensis]|uniref:Pescadillo homolog n=1 Tax=Naegleria lovaniensis TaxID=51637 RepID=A0AA88GFC2_NAELO|nr:uncharacterized protein C9374_011728 [Naegleria lovaniensis]KAG2373843.1 hypothetical protein C9374_011728 [Naegleria lovaniensis]
MGKAPQKNFFATKDLTKAKYVSKNSAQERLQISRANFRHLLILKGIHPKVPEKNSKAKNVAKYAKDKTYYYKKDVNFIAHDPLLDKLREYKTYLRRVAKAKGRGDVEHLERLKELEPEFTYDHLVKERYPSFQAALNDLNDCLCILFMYTQLPAGLGKVTAEMTENAKRLCDEFCSYVCQTKSLRKVFLSFKGIYYQANIQGVDITWIVPYDFPQVIPENIDFNIFRSFIQFYLTLLTFVNYKLYNDANIEYPPKYTAKSDKSYLIDLKQGGAEDENVDLRSVAGPAIEQDEKKASSPEEVFMNKFKGMFKGLVFYFSRECPKSALEFIVKSFGGECGWASEDSPFDETHDKITHMVVDRKIAPEKMIKDREYVQPQYVFDCVNAMIKLPVEPYAPGKKLPPHLSPFVEYKKDTYMPKYAEEIRAMVEKELKLIKKQYQQDVEDDQEEAEILEDLDDDSDEEEERHHMELVAEIEGKKFADVQQELEKARQKSKDELKLQQLSNKPRNKKEEREQELIEMRKVMASRRNRKLYDRIQKLQRGKNAYNKQLLKRRMKLEEEEKKAKQMEDNVEDTMVDEGEEHDVEEEERDNTTPSKSHRNKQEVRPEDSEEEDDDLLGQFAEDDDEEDSDDIELV